MLALQGKHWSAYISRVLDVVAGYGYKPLNCLLVYIALQAIFTGVFFALGHFTMSYPADERTFLGALILSITSFHGRAFLPQAVSTTIDSDYLAYGMVAAVEGVIGLFIESVFVATLIQRFFR